MKFTSSQSENEKEKFADKGLICVGKIQRKYKF